MISAQIAKPLKDEMMMKMVLAKRILLIAGVAVLFLIGGSSSNHAVASNSDYIWIYGSISPHQANTYGFMTNWNLKYEVWALDGIRGRMDWGSLTADSMGNYVIKVNNPKFYKPGVHLIITVPGAWNNWPGRADVVLYSDGNYCSQLTAPTIRVSQKVIR